MLLVIVILLWQGTGMLMLVMKIVSSSRGRTQTPVFPLTNNCEELAKKTNRDQIEDKTLQMFFFLECISIYAKFD